MSSKSAFTTTKTRGTAAAPASRRVPPASRLFEELVEGEPVVGISAVHAIRAGFSADMLKSASRFFDVPEKTLYQITHIAPSTAHRLLQKRARIDPAASERIVRMSDFTRMAQEVFEDRESALAWLKRPNGALGGAAPLELADTEPGAMAVRQILNAIATGGAL